MGRFTNGELDALIYAAEQTPARNPQEDRALERDALLRIVPLLFGHHHDAELR